MALGTFLDIDGAFDNVSFDAIERALDSKCKSADVNRWISSMIHNRQTTVELQGERRTIAIRRGCPQGGILSPFLWNLVVNELLEYTRNKIPSDLQGFADDLASIVTAPRQTNGRQGYDADILREVTQKSLNNINLWCRKSGLKLSHLKTHCVMFTKRRNWSFSRPLKVDGIEIEVQKSTKFLGIILDSKLSWNEHIENVCKKAKGILMQCRKAVGPTWGFKPATMRWVYEVMVRPVLGYGATIWLNGSPVYKGRPPKSRIFKPPPLPLSGCVRISKTTPPPRTSASGFSNFTHFSIFTHFYFCLIKQSLLPNSCFYQV